MKCPNDQIEMKKGFLNNQGASWSDDSGEASYLQAASPYYTVVAYRCEDCGKVELTIEQKQVEEDRKKGDSETSSE